MSTLTATLRGRTHLVSRVEEAATLVSMGVCLLPHASVGDSAARSAGRRRHRHECVPAAMSVSGKQALLRIVETAHGAKAVVACWGQRS